MNATEKMKLLTVHKENFVNVVESASNDLTVKFTDVFNKALGTLPGKVHLQVDPNSNPVILPDRKVPLSRERSLRRNLSSWKPLK